MPRKKILVTGATGLIGRYALEPLRQSGFEVTACSRKSFVGAEAAQADLLDTKAIATLFRRLRPDYLLHFAWDVRPGIY
ncbi:MAG: NAD-dependent epimerase/dehydratase family protein, partial [Deltaproteobacteria bacterium]|nr:NAD-dependent epimerase/dehydratase family protein [Deltaproteobacteria bacterium]